MDAGVNVVKQVSFLRSAGRTAKYLMYSGRMRYAPVAYHFVIVSVGRTGVIFGTTIALSPARNRTGKRVIWARAPEFEFAELGCACSRNPGLPYQSIALFR